jgi:hypothetical protein
MTLNKARISLLDVVDDVPDDLGDLYAKTLTGLCNATKENGLVRSLLRSEIDLAKASRDLAILNENAEKIIKEAKEEREKKLKMIANDFI